MLHYYQWRAADNTEHSTTLGYDEPLSLDWLRVFRDDAKPGYVFTYIGTDRNEMDKLCLRYDKFGYVTVGELRAKLDGKADDLPVLVPNLSSDMDYVSARTITVQSVKWHMDDCDIVDGGEDDEDRLCLVIE